MGPLRPEAGSAETILSAVWSGLTRGWGAPPFGSRPFSLGHAASSCGGCGRTSSAGVTPAGLVPLILTEVILERHLTSDF